MRAVGSVVSLFTGPLVMSTQLPFQAVRTPGRGFAAHEGDLSRGNGMLGQIGKFDVSVSESHLNYKEDKDLVILCVTRLK